MAAGPCPGSSNALSLRALPALLGVLAALSAALLTAPAPAGADVFGPISLVSAGVLGGGEPQQAEYAHDPAISGNGQYVAFDGSLGGVTGVWRRDLATGVVEQVAGGDAELPSISEDGRYISFTTNEGASLTEITDDRSDAHPKQEAVNVYVRDMAVPIPASGHCEPSPQPCPFTVVSAPDESAKPLTYEAAGTFLGSAAVGRSAMSADGREVAFVTAAVSNLVQSKQEKEAEARGQTPQPKTPPLQVAVRYLGTDRTVLVSGRYVEGRTTEEPVSVQEGATTYGAVFPGAGWKFGPPPPYGQYGKTPPLGASLSADGSTVAWMGADIGEQAQLLPGETRSPTYTEPLWRRIAPGLADADRADHRRLGPNEPRVRGERRARAAGDSLPLGPLSGPVRGGGRVGAGERDLGRRRRGSGRLRSAAERRRLHGGVPLRGAARIAR